jgi:hypothetical protein
MQRLGLNDVEGEDDSIRAMEKGKKWDEKRPFQAVSYGRVSNGGRAERTPGGGRERT